MSWSEQRSIQRIPTIDITFEDNPQHKTREKQIYETRMSKCIVKAVRQTRNQKQKTWERDRRKRRKRGREGREKEREGDTIFLQQGAVLKWENHRVFRKKTFHENSRAIFPFSPKKKSTSAVTEFPTRNIANMKHVLLLIFRPNVCCTVHTAYLYRALCLRRKVRDPW